MMRMALVYLPADKDEKGNPLSSILGERTRAKDNLHLIVPQRFFAHSQQSNGDRHMYAARTRFIPDDILDNFQGCAWPVDATVPRRGTRRQFTALNRQAQRLYRRLRKSGTRVDQKPALTPVEGERSPRFSCSRQLWAVELLHAFVAVPLALMMRCKLRLEARRGPRPAIV
jgi:hypothetical protein